MTNARNGKTQRKLRRVSDLRVIWEAVPDPDGHALLKAVEMLFKRKQPMNTVSFRPSAEASCGLE